MTLVLNGEGTEREVSVKTYGIGDLKNKVLFGEYEISLKDFLHAASYVLMNTDLEPNDPRLEFAKHVRSMREREGYNKGGTRLRAIVPFG